MIIIGYLAFYQLLAHDALYHFHVVEYANGIRKGHNTSLTQANLLARLTYQPLALLVGSGLGGVLLLALLALAKGRGLGSDERFWLTLAGSSLAFYWLGSTSLAYYNPNSLLPRMLTPLLPPLCLAAGVGLDYFVHTSRGGGWLAAGLLGSATWLSNSLSVIYGLLGGYFLIVAGLKVTRRLSFYRPGTVFFAGLTLAAVGLSTAIRPVYFMFKPSVSGYFAQQRLLRQELRGPAGGVVLVDYFHIQKYPFFYEFRVPAGLQFLHYDAYDTLRAVPGRPTWLLINRPILHNDELSRGVIPYSVEQVLARFRSASSRLKMET